MKPDVINDTVGIFQFKYSERLPTKKKDVDTIVHKLVELENLIYYISLNLELDCRRDGGGRRVYI